MAEFNPFAQLVNEKDYKDLENFYNSLLEMGKDPLSEMFSMQLQFQKELNSKLPYMNPIPTELETIGEKIDWMKRNFDSIMDEFRELLTSFGGMSNGESKASAAWKAWKADHQKIREKKFEELSNSDKLEVYFEMIDIWHFIISMFLALNISSKEIFILYMLKNKANFKRHDGKN